MAVSEYVSRIVPDNWAEAPIKEYFPTSPQSMSGKHLYSNVPTMRPQAAPVNRVGMKIPLEIDMP